ncbi:MAG: hypothetical protein E3J71_08310 [Candidatus Stahlbacteria bacterium]|nr:MAG: hypothetical protein E3J71_08310 [Candidatus Stahlbacteria bacterium]
MITLLLSLLASWGQGLYEVPDMPVTPFTSSDYNFEVLDHWPYGSGFSVLRDSDYLFYTNGAVLQIGEVNSSGEVSWFSELRFSGMAYTMVRFEDRLYVAIDDQGVAIVDISLLDDPQLINLFPAGGRVFGLEVRGDTLYTAMGSEGLEIYDCRNPSNPQLLGSLFGFNLRSLELYGDLLYATDVSTGLLVLDVSDPTNPVAIGELGLTGQHYGLALDSLRDKAVVCSFDGGMHVVDVSMPYDPVLFASIPIFVAWDVDLDDTLAYVASWDDSLHIINILSGEGIGGLGFDTLGVTGVWPYDVSVEGDYGAVAGFLGSWWVFEVSDPENPFVTDGEARGGVSDVVVANDRWIVLGMHGSKLVFFERSDSLIPVGSISSADWPRDLEIRGDTLYVAESWAGLGLYHMDDPVSGVNLISRLSMDGVHVWALEVDSSFAYLACGDSGLIVVDLSNPSFPSEAARIHLDARALSVFKRGDTAYVGFEESGIGLVDVSVPDSPFFLETKPTAGGVLDMALQDSLLFVAQATEGAAIYDISGLDWQLLSTIPTEHVNFSLVLEAGNLFLAHGAAGIYAYDVANPSFPHLVGSLNTGGESRDIASLGDTLLVADGYDGLLRVLFLGLGIDESSALPASVLDVWPNPFSSVLYFSRPVQARLYDASGRLQANIHGARFDASELLAGVYFIRGKNWYCKVVKAPSSR